MLKLISTTMFSSLFFSAIQGQIQYKFPSNVSVQKDYSEHEIKATGKLYLYGKRYLVFLGGFRYSYLLGVVERAVVHVCFRLMEPATPEV